MINQQVGSPSMCTAPQAPAEPEPEPKFCALRKRAENLERLPAVPTSGKGPRCDSWARGNTERVCDCCCDSEVRCDARILDGILPPAPMPALTLALAPRTEVPWGYRLARAGHPTSSGFAAGAPSPRRREPAVVVVARSFPSGRSRGAATARPSLPQPPQDPGGGQRRP